MQSTPMEFSEIDGGADPARPLIYLWEIIDLDGQVCCRYVGKASRGAHRPRTQYRRNVNNILQGRPYRKSKPDEFRPIHRQMAEAVQSGHTLRLSFLCNIEDSENINALERKWQQHYGLV